MYVIKEPEKYSFDKVGIKGKIFPIEDLADSTQYFLVETDGGHQTIIIEKKCDFIYYVLEGSGSFDIEGVNENCGKGDLVVIPKGKKFSYKGKLKMIATSTPPWNEDQEVTI